MTPTAPGSFDAIELVSQSGPIALITLGVLALMSVLSWATWGSRRLALSRLEGQSRRAREAFLRTTDTNAFAELCRELPGGPVPRMFAAAHAEYEDLVRAQGDNAMSWNVLQAEAGRRLLVRTLQGARAGELEDARRGQMMLATVGATAPFVGLFGTVWGVIRAFAEIAAARSADLAVVAPGIAEALVATAAGLIAAVPAVWFYNSLSARRVRRLGVELDHFAIEFLNVYDRACVAQGGEERVGT